ncbi:TrmB family transcriptional regulator [Streptomyces sp. NPDC048419]|uniref:TrmB family transcriptional regulator n=1 Tax=Streptomyces sp. NPDC048419 TaxID=3365547 RepID=UPI00371924C6
MELEDAAVNDLMSLGLARYEARVYLTLIRRGSYTAAEVSREADVPRQRVYDVLDALVRRQLATTRPGRVATYCAVTPELALARLMALQRESVDRLERVSQALAATLQPMWSLGREHTNPLDYIEILRDPKAISERFADIQQARHELLTLCKPPFVAPTENAEGIAAVRRLHEAGGTVRAIYLNDALDDPETAEHVRRFTASGEEARFASELPLKLVIADASLVLCDMPDPVAGAGSTTTLFIEHPALAACLRLAFNTMWEHAVPGPACSPAP